MENTPEAQKGIKIINIAELKSGNEIKAQILGKHPNYYNINEEIYVTIEGILEDGEKEVRLILFDEYVELMTELWNDPIYGKDEADRITIKDKMEDADPYNIFYNTLKMCPETKEQLYSIDFRDLLCPSLGKLKASFHATFIAEFLWILEEFASRKLHNLPISIIYGQALPWPKEETMKKLYPNVDFHVIFKEEGTLGAHHTKLSIFLYDDDSLRVMVGSANLFSKDWDCYNQQLWVSPRCPKLPPNSSLFDGDSPTGFKLALLDYLFAYKEQNTAFLERWIECIQAADFSQVKVSLIFAVPGVHQPRRNGCPTHFLGHLLKDCVIPAPKEEHNSWRIIMQTGSLGLVGKYPDEWLTTNFLKALSSNKELPYLPTLYSVSKVKFDIIYPTLQNCLDGYLGFKSADCCMYEKGVKEAQPWLKQYQCIWKADNTKRTRAIAHAKSYCRISPCHQKMVYYFLTSANLSRSGWGVRPNSDSSIFIRSYEMGVLFLPKYFGEEYFEIMDVPNRKNKRLFPMMFDLPLTPYGPKDEAFCWEEVIEKLHIVIRDSETDLVKMKFVDSSPIDVKHNFHISTINNRSKNPPKKEAEKSDANPVLTGQRDMKYNSQPTGNNMFFPTFRKS